MTNFIDLTSLGINGEKPPGYFAVTWAVADWLKRTFQLDLKQMRTHTLFHQDATISGVYVWLTPEQELLMRLKYS